MKHEHERPDALCHFCLALDHMIDTAVQARIITQEESKPIKDALWDMNIALRKKEAAE
jgi:hypothetical protein